MRGKEGADAETEGVLGNIGGLEKIDRLVKVEALVRPGVSTIVTDH